MSMLDYLRDRLWKTRNHIDWARLIEDLKAANGGEGKTVVFPELPPSAFMQGYLNIAECSKGKPTEPPNEPSLDEAIVTNEKGGKQSKLDARLDLFPPAAWLRIGEVFAFGATKYAPDNWRLIESESHLNHALCHIAEYMKGNNEDDHAGHAACRIVMWLEMLIQEGKI